MPSDRLTEHPDFAEYESAIAALRMLAVIAGDVLPRPDEPIDIVLMAALCRHDRSMPA